jgi:hypothetical protein
MPRFLIDGRAYDTPEAVKADILELDPTGRSKGAGGLVADRYGRLPLLADPAPSCLLGASRRGERITELLQASIPGGISAQVAPPGSCLGEVVSGLIVSSLLAAKPAQCVQDLRPKAVVLGVGGPGGQRGRQKLVGLL